MKCETVKIKASNADGFCIINKSDFNPAKHEIYGAKPKVEVKIESKPEPKKPTKKKVSKK